jgi:hypothetical protein
MLLPQLFPVLLKASMIYSAYGKQAISSILLLGEKGARIPVPSLNGRGLE